MRSCEHACRPRRAAVRPGGPWRRSSAKPRAWEEAARSPSTGSGRDAASSRPARSTGPGSASSSARCRRFSISASTACWYSLYVSARPPPAPVGGRDLAQVPAQRRVAVEAERDREAGDGRLADPGQLGQLHARQERHVGGPPDHAVRDAPLGGRQPVPLEELLQPRGAGCSPHAVPLLILAGSLAPRSASRHGRRRQIHSARKAPACPYAAAGSGWTGGLRPGIRGLAPVPRPAALVP